MNPSYGITRELPETSYDEAVERLTAALQDQGFSVLTRIDMKAVMKDKLGVDLRPYLILGACSPTFAHQALAAEPGIGLLLPCNVVVAEREEGGAVVSAIDPIKVFALADRDDVSGVAEQIRAKLWAVIDNL